MFGLAIHHDPCWHLGIFWLVSLLRVTYKCDSLTLIIHFLIQVSHRRKTSPFKGESQFLGVFFGGSQVQSGAVISTQLQNLLERWGISEGFPTRKIPTWLPNRCPTDPPQKKAWLAWLGGETNSEFAGFYIDPKKWLDEQATQGPFWISIDE